MMTARDQDWMLPVAIILAIEMTLWLFLFRQGVTYAPQLTAVETIAASALTLVAAFHVLRFLWLTRAADGPLRRLGSAIADNRAHLLNVFLGLQFAVVGISAFCALKAGIPFAVPFWLDAPLYDFEAALFGAPPWQISQQWLGAFTPAIELAYSTFVPVSMIALFGLISTKPSELKSRALVSLFLIWLLLGVVAAYVLSSAGPIFFDRVHGGDRLAGLAAALQSAPVSVRTADALWVSHQFGDPMVGNGISAMPSLHVATTMWLALVLRRSRWAPLAWAYLGLICLGSVHLGWHYALDGIAGIAGAVAIWAVAPAFIGAVASHPDRFRARTA